MRTKINTEINKKFEIGDKVIYIKKSEREPGWKITDHDLYIINKHAYNIDESNNFKGFTNYYGVKHKDGVESTWYDEMDFISLKEYRKLKLEKLINGIK